jgi:hypothetical protein
MHGLLAKHDIDPSKAPIPAKKPNANAKAPTSDAKFQAEVGLAALKGDASIDKLCRDFLVDKQFIKSCRDTISKNAVSLFEKGGD